jgi:hypothetical protein
LSNWVAARALGAAAMAAATATPRSVANVVLLAKAISLSLLNGLYWENVGRSKVGLAPPDPGTPG